MFEALASDVRGELTAVNRLVQDRQRLGAQKGGREEFVGAGDFQSFPGQMEDGAGVDDEPIIEYLRSAFERRPD